MLLLSHPTGNANVRAAAHAFYAAGWLRELDSCFCWNPTSRFSQLLPNRITSHLQRRSFTGIPVKIQHSYPWRELGRFISSAYSLPWLSHHEIGPFSIDAVYRSFDQHVSNRLPKLAGLQAVYAYEDGALLTFQVADRLGLRRIYDLPIGYWRAAQQIFKEERELQPDWACTLTGLNDSPAKLARKDKELQLADLVVVPSKFVRNTLQEYTASSAPIAVVPFGSPPPNPLPLQAPAGGPLRVLYVGSLGQRKGLSYALDAVEAVGELVSFTLIGRLTSRECRPLTTALLRHQWIESLPHDQILKQMRQHDVLLLPSLFEGFALVIGEALSQGLPVIATTNSGATEVVRDGVEGFIVPIRDSLAISERLHHLVSNPGQLAVMRQACLRRAAELSWAEYELALRAAVGRVLHHAHS